MAEGLVVGQKVILLIPTTSAAMKKSILVNNNTDGLEVVTIQENVFFGHAQRGFGDDFVSQNGRQRSRQQIRTTLVR